MTQESRLRWVCKCGNDNPVEWPYCRYCQRWTPKADRVLIEVRERMRG